MLRIHSETVCLLALAAELMKVGTIGLYVYGMIQYCIMDTERSMHMSQFSFACN